MYMILFNMECYNIITFKSFYYNSRNQFRCVPQNISGTNSNAVVFSVLKIILFLIVECILITILYNIIYRYLSHYYGV